MAEPDAVSLTLPPGLERYLVHMPDENDLILNVLKGHLLIEEVLVEIINASVFHPEKIDHERFQFHHRLALAQAFDKNDPPKDEVWLVIGKLNALRNKLVHNLEPTEVEKRVEELLKAFESAAGGWKQFEKDSTPEKLRVVVIYLLGFLESAKRSAQFLQRASSNLRAAAEHMRKKEAATVHDTLPPDDMPK